MDHTTVINEKIYDMNFLAAWIKYTRRTKVSATRSFGEIINS